MNNILVTGGAGYIGSVIVQNLKKKYKHKIIVIDNLSTGKKKFVPNDVIFQKLNLQNYQKTKGFFLKHKIDIIIHFAASISVEESQIKKEKYKKNNIEATRNLIKLAKEFNIKKFIFASTAAVYGNHKNIQSFSESTKCKPNNYYGKTKFISEKDIVKNFNKSNESFAILRFFNVVGSSLNYKTGPIPTYSKHLIKNICESIIKKKFIVNIYGKNYPTRDGTCIRDYIHVEDLSSIVNKICYEMLKNKKNFKSILNCGYGNGLTVYEIIKTYEKIIKKKININFQGRRKGDTAVVVCKNNKIKKQIKWKPKYNHINFMLKNALNWFEKYYELNDR